ncbi:MAG TPA: DNA primase [Candidatus Paceibacterota bacterium]|nr:DNA primase [Candidatus Paceibacterota bacterium]
MDTVEQVKAKLTIVDVVSPYVKLTKAGRNWRGLSPFNKEKTPSFYVNPERGTYYCFSSGQGGDHFEFIQKMEGVDFKGALKILAEKAGIEVVYTGGKSKQDKDKQDRLYEAMARAEALYASMLEEGKGVDGSAYSYARKRGLSLETIKEWNLGYAPEAWRMVLEKLGEAGFTNPELIAAGLVKEADEKKGTFYDRFRNRLMFPIRDSAGRTVAFTGRALDPNDQAKYLNSPETDLYKKSEILFGMDRAKDAIRQRGFALLVEGQMDLLMLHQIGFTNTIALSGTALTPQHLSLIKRYADNLMLALDSDRAGLNASMKNAIAALRAGMRVKAVKLPQGKDPADLAVEDPKDLTKRISEAAPIVEFFLAVLSESEPDSHRLILLAEKTVLPLMAAIESPMEREHFVGVAARSLGSTPEAIRAGIARVAKEGNQAPEARRAAGPVPAPQVKRTQTQMHGARLHAIYMQYPDSLIAKRLENEYSRVIGAPFPDEPPPENEIFEAGIAYGEAPGETDADDLVRAFEKAHITEQLQAATVRLRVAEAARDEAAMRKAEQECQSLTKLLASF